MISGKSVLALIPARGGSRRCPDKNISLYQNKSTGEIFSLVEWAIRHAKSSKYIDTIALSSDSDIILSHAHPPVIPILRPDFLASAHTTSEAVIAHAIYSLTQLGEHHIGLHDITVLLQPTSPLRTAADIDKGIELTASLGYSHASVNSTTRLRNGAVYSTPTTSFLSSLSLSRAQPFPMPPERSLDIDFPEDFAK